MIMTLAGNKWDLVKDDANARHVTTEEAQTFANDNGLLFLETSAKDGTNVDRLFEQIAEKLPRVEVPQPASNLILEGSQPQASKSTCC